MKLDAMFLADTASVVSDTLAVTGGLWDGLTASALPASHTIVVVLLLRPDLGDVGRSSHLDLHLTGPDGGPAGQEHVDVTLNAFRRQVPVVVRVKGTFPQHGTYTVRLVSQVGTDTLAFDVVSADTTVGNAVAGYALGLKR